MLKIGFGKNNYGFTIMEIMVSFSIITLGLVGAMSLAGQNVQAENVNKNTIISSKLAQEGLELVRNRRDDNWLKEENWIYSSSTNSNFDIIQDGTYTIDHTGNINAVPNSLGDNETKLYFDAQNFFTHSPSAKGTIFSRLIRAEVLSANSAKITCLVRWSKGSNNHDISVSTEIFDWR